MTNQKYVDQLSYSLIGAAIEVHKELGPGLLESVYHKFLKHELLLRRISFQSNLSVKILYKGIEEQSELRCDLLIEECIAVELKSVEALHPLHSAELH
jgi:GxxExxY protein